jgi:predicted secreted protein
MFHLFKLINSIEFKVKKTQNGFLFNLKAVEYFTPLDDKYKISRNVFESTNYKNLITKITDVYSIYIQEQITT